MTAPATTPAAIPLLHLKTTHMAIRIATTVSHSSSPRNGFQSAQFATKNKKCIYLTSSRRPQPLRTLGKDERNETKRTLPKQKKNREKRVAILAKKAISSRSLPVQTRPVTYPSRPSGRRQLGNSTVLHSSEMIVRKTNGHMALASIWTHRSSDTGSAECEFVPKVHPSMSSLFPG